VKKWIVAALVAAALGGVAFIAWPRLFPKEAPVVEAKTVAERGPLSELVFSDGKVVSNLDVEIKCKASGEIIRLPFDVSSRVKKGDLLVELDPVDEERSVRQAEAALDAALAKLAAARENLAVSEGDLAASKKQADATLTAARASEADAKAKARRVAELFERKLASREETETAETSAVRAAADREAAEAARAELDSRERSLEATRQQIRAAEAEVEIDRIALEVARQRLADTRVAAPMDGVVTERSVQVGQIISSPISNVGGGTTVLTLSDLSRMFVLASVDESDIGRIRLGQRARVKVDAFPDRRFGGTVVQVSPRGVNVSNVVTFEVKIEMDEKERDLLRPEMTASIEIVIAERESALYVPLEAVYRKGGKSFVSIPAPGGETDAETTAEERVVETGMNDGKNVEILSGIVEGEAVVPKKSESNSRWRGPTPFGMRRSR